MIHQIKYSPIAIRDLDRIWFEVFSASKEPKITEKYIGDLLDKIKTKSEFPKTGIPLYYENLFTGYYFTRFKSYLAFYRIDGNQILVDRILYAKSDYMNIMGIASSEDTDPEQ